jgi:hypothetical protein
MFKYGLSGFLLGLLFSVGTFFYGSAYEESTYILVKNLQTGTYGAYMIPLEHLEYSLSYGVTLPYDVASNIFKGWRPRYWQPVFPVENKEPKNKKK